MKGLSKGISHVYKELRARLQVSKCKLLPTCAFAADFCFFSRPSHLPWLLAPGEPSSEVGSLIVLGGAFVTVPIFEFMATGFVYSRPFLLLPQLSA